MLNAVRHLNSKPGLRLLTDGGAASACGLATIATLTIELPFVRRRQENFMFKVDSVVAAYETHEQAERAIQELQHAGIDMKAQSIAARDTRLTEHVTSYYSARERMLYGVNSVPSGALWELVL